MAKCIAVTACDNQDPLKPVVTIHWIDDSPEIDLQDDFLCHDDGCEIKRVVNSCLDGVPDGPVKTKENQPSVYHYWESKDDELIVSSYDDEEFVCAANYPRAQFKQQLEKLATDIQSCCKCGI